MEKNIFELLSNEDLENIARDIDVASSEGLGRTSLNTSKGFNEELKKRGIKFKIYLGWKEAE